MHDKQKSINSNNPDSLLKVLANGKLVQLVFVIHMSNLSDAFVTVAFLLPVSIYIYILKDFENASPRLNPLFHKPGECQRDNCYCIT